MKYVLAGAGRRESDVAYFKRPVSERERDLQVSTHSSIPLS